MLGWNRSRRAAARRAAADAEAKRALQESEWRYRALLETAPDAVFVHRNGRVILANPQAAVLFGADEPGDLIGRDVFGLVAEESRALARSRTADLQKPGARAVLASLTYCRLDGTAFAVEAAAAAVRLDGELVIQVVFRDVTAREEANAALKARTAELETMMETVPVAVWLAQGVGAPRIIGNRQASRMLRLDEQSNRFAHGPGQGAAGALSRA